ncbi:MAG: NUDIX domain-containing protein [Oscillospiraceae bacterium]|jgi:8-oxo-dGTP diphosphatase|nr:NUDIX domain-containing protein [Oscillospiraceae bacterium]
MEYRIIECITYPYNTLSEYKYADIISVYKGKWVLSKHKNRTTWESQGGHIEISETPLVAAKRELFEESGAIDFEIEPLCDYWVHAIVDGIVLKANGQVFFANIYTFGDIPIESEIEKIFLFDYPPKNLTYPEYAKEEYPLALKRKEEK